jgi:hypothetical protein
MNLFERFWEAMDELRAERRNGAEPFGLTLNPVHAPDGVQSEAGRDISAVVRAGLRRFPPYVVNQEAFSPRPFCLIYTVTAELPQFHELFEQYVDKNAFIAETLLRLKPHCEIPYILFLGKKSFFLYDVNQEELIRWGNDFAGLDETFLTPLSESADLAAEWDKAPRKTNSQKAEEFGRWLDLWKVGIGARTNATPAFMQVLMQKVILLFLYDQMIGLQEPELGLRRNFLEHRQAAPLAGAQNVYSLPFDGVAWLHQASSEVLGRYDIEFMEWTSAESNFFALMSAETRQQFSQFVMELFLLSQAKFCSAVQTDVFSDVNSKLKLWKFSVTETLNIRRRLQADDVNVYEPIWIDLEESGIGWALHVIKQVLDFWRERCIYFEQQLVERRQLKLQFDMFQQPDLDRIRVPVISDIFDQTFTTSVRVSYDFPAERLTLEYLVIVRLIEFCNETGVPLRPLHKLDEMFLEKEHIAMVQEM